MHTCAVLLQSMTLHWFSAGGFQETQTLQDNSALLTQLNNMTLRAKKLYDLKLRTFVTCAADCVRLQTCYYVTMGKPSVSISTTVCSLYTSGSIFYNVSDLILYEIPERLRQVY